MFLKLKPFNDMKANKINTRFINKIKRYLNEINVPFMELGQTRNLVVLRANSTHHYLLIHFYDMPYNAMENFKYFKVKRIYPTDKDQIIELVKKYLDEN